MTREEAVKGLDRLKTIIWKESNMQIALNMAIEALEQEPCEDKRTDKRTGTHACDCISRQAAIDGVKTLHDVAWKKMSKYETGDKFIITIGEVFGNEPTSIYKAEGTNTLYLNDAQLNKLEEQIQTMQELEAAQIEKAYELGKADRPTGHWIETAQAYYEMINEKGGGVDENTPYFIDDIACSECLAKFSVMDNETERFDFCPNCGADMRGGE